MVPRPATPESSPCRNGFTLIELLVVVVIVGIVSAIVLLSPGLVGDDRGLRQEARRMASLFELAADEALLQGRDFGVEIMASGYRFVEHDPYLNRWHEIVGDDLLRQRSLPESMQFELFIEDRRVLLNETPAKIDIDEDDELKNDPAADYAPHALLLSSGEISPMQVEILRETDRRRVTVEISAAGEIEIQDHDDQSD
jgi:general secretion pathway protein H